MALNLMKSGERFNLAKEAPALKVAGIGLGWDPNEEEDGPDFDLDVSAFLLGADGKVPADEYVVFYGSQLKENFFNEKDEKTGQPLLRPYSGDTSTIGAVDAIDGTESDGEDDEDMRIYFDKIWEGIHEIAITVSITKYPNDTKKDRRTLLQNFGMVNDCYIRVWDNDTNVEILRYNLKEQFTNEDALVFGKFIRVANSWEFVATGEKHNGSLNKLIELYT